MRRVRSRARAYFRPSTGAAPLDQRDDAASSSSRRSRRWTAAFVAGGSVLAASSRSESVGCRSLSSAASRRGSGAAPGDLLLAAVRRPRAGVAPSGSFARDGVVGVGEPIRTRARLGDHRALLEREPPPTIPSARVSTRSSPGSSHTRSSAWFARPGRGSMPSVPATSRRKGEGRRRRSQARDESATRRWTRRRGTRRASRPHGSTRDRRRCAAAAREEHVVDRRHPPLRGRAGRASPATCSW